MDDERARRAAELIWENWHECLCVQSLPDYCRPRTVAEGYAAQAALEAVSRARVVGWKIAATSRAGQAHIAVDGPLAGRLLERQVHHHPATVPFGSNNMRVAEAEFAFVLKQDIAPREKRYEPEELRDYVGSLHPAIEIPDSRFEVFTEAGAAQLIADNACAHRFVLGNAADGDWREADLAQHEVLLRINEEEVVRGYGSDVLGDPWVALAWIANSHGERGEGLRAQQIITTGVCGRPCPVSPGDHVVADFGRFGRAEVKFSS